MEKCIVNYKIHVQILASLIFNLKDKPMILKELLNGFLANYVL